MEESPLTLAYKLNSREKILRSLKLISDMWYKYGNTMVFANSLGKDSLAVWHLCKEAAPEMKGFIVTTRFKPPETKEFMMQFIKKYPETVIYENTNEIPENLHKTDPEKCCELLKVSPTRQALKDLGARCWVTGLRCTEGHTRSDFQEIEMKGDGYLKLNPILLWTEREVWMYLALNKIDVNPLYKKGYRSLGCLPCSEVISAGQTERHGRWLGTDKQSGECGIHSKGLK